jgi:hypothetical protein
MRASATILRPDESWTLRRGVAVWSSWRVAAISQFSQILVQTDASHQGVD